MYIDRQDLEDRVAFYRAKAESSKNKADGRTVLARLCGVTAVASSIVLSGEWKLVALPFLGGMIVEFYGAYQERQEQQRYENRIKHHQEKIECTWGSQ